MVSAEVAGPAPSGAGSAGRSGSGRVRRVFDRHFDGIDLYELRAAVSGHVAGVAAERVGEAVVLIAHELCSNAVRHGGGSGRIRIWSDAGNIYCQVIDEGPGLSDPDDAGRTLPPPTLPGGRGLWIARTMSEVHIDAGPAGTTVTAVVAR